MPITFASCAPERDTHAEPLFRFTSLWQAYLACRKGKQRSASAQRYALNLFDQLLATVAALQNRQWKPSAATCFVVSRPKAREVLAAAFADRVVHHLLVPALERQFEPVFIFDAWSNRRGKGIHGAVQRLRGFMQALTVNGAREGWSLQLDIANFFNRIDRAHLFGLLQRCWVRSDPTRTVIDLPNPARETLTARIASYAAHFQHAAHGRLWQRLRARHALLRRLFQPPIAGRCQPLWQPPRHLYRLPDQWRWFHRQCPHWFSWPPGAQPDDFRPWLLWLQVGRMLETYGDHARRIDTHWPRHGGQPIWRRGLGAGLAWPRRRLPALSARANRWGCHGAWVAETATLPHSGRRRVLRRLLLSHPLPLFATTSSAIPGCSS